MEARSLTCTELSQDRIVAWFRDCEDQSRIFAYLPHVPGLNPLLLKVGDRIQGRTKFRNGKLELVEGFGQRTWLQNLSELDPVQERICLPYPRPEE